MLRSTKRRKRNTQAHTSIHEQSVQRFEKFETAVQRSRCDVCRPLEQRPFVAPHERFLQTGHDAGHRHKSGHGMTYLLSLASLAACSYVNYRLGSFLISSVFASKTASRILFVSLALQHKVVAAKHTSCMQLSPFTRVNDPYVSRIGM